MKKNTCFGHTIKEFTHTSGTSAPQRASTRLSTRDHYGSCQVSWAAALHLRMSFSLPSCLLIYSLFTSRWSVHFTFMGHPSRLCHARSVIRRSRRVAPDSIRVPVEAGGASIRSVRPPRAYPRRVEPRRVDPRHVPSRDASIRASRVAPVRSALCKTRRADPRPVQPCRVRAVSSRARVPSAPSRVAPYRSRSVKPRHADPHACRSRGASIRAYVDRAVPIRAM